MIVPLAAVEPPAPRSESPAVPPPPTVPLAEPAVFHAVSEHQDSEAHRPVRRRRHHDEAGAAPAQAPLMLVETQAETPAPVVEDELPRRTKPRRRRNAQVQAEPLTLVETQGKPAEPPAP